MLDATAAAAALRSPRSGTIVVWIVERLSRKSRSTPKMNFPTRIAYFPRHFYSSMTRIARTARRRAMVGAQFANTNVTADGSIGPDVERFRESTGPILAARQRSRNEKQDTPARTQGLISTLSSAINGINPYLGESKNMQFHEFLSTKPLDCYR